MADIYKNMSIDELETALQALKDDLIDTEEVRDMVLGQTGNHISSGNAEKFARQIEELQEKITAIEKAISERG